MTVPDRTERFELRMTPAEKARWSRLAAQTGESFASWWRGLAREAEKRAKRGEEE